MTLLLVGLVWQIVDARQLEEESLIIEEKIHISELIDYKNPFSELTDYQNPITPQVLGVVVDSTEYIIAQYDWDVRLATAIFKAESQLEPQAINREDNHKVCMGSFGITQIGCVHFGKYGIDWNNWDDPEVNVRAAYLLYKERGWKPWGAFTSKAYLRYY